MGYEMKRFLLFVLLGLVIFGLAGCSELFSGKYRIYKVKEVLSSDTLLLENGKIARLIGIAGPDTEDLGLSKEKTADFSEQARRLSQELVEGKHVRFEFDIRRKDSFGRLLVYCFAADTLLNARLLEEGLAFLSLNPPNLRFEDVLLKAGNRAKEERSGLFSEVRAINYSKADKFLDQFRFVEGKVLSVRRGKKGYRLNFTRARRQPFCVVIFNKDIPLFTSGGAVLKKAYGNKVIRVNGRITKRRGQICIIAQHPSQIEVVK